MSLNKIYYKDARTMSEIEDNSVRLVITSPPYWNIKDYSKDGYQKIKHSNDKKGQLGSINDYKKYISELIKIWNECKRILKPNGKLCINTPLMPIPKKQFNTHYNRDIVNINADIEHEVKSMVGLYLYDIFIWDRENSSKKLMFGSYPYPPNFYVQNTVEFITVFVKDGRPEYVPKSIREKSKLTEKEWVTFTKQVWNIPIPGKNDIAFGKHSAIMPEEIVRRLIKLFSFVGDIVLDPFCGSGTTLKVAQDLGRNYIGYEICEHYKNIIDKKLAQRNLII